MFRCAHLSSTYHFWYGIRVCLYFLLKFVAFINNLPGILLGVLASSCIVIVNWLPASFMLYYPRVCTLFPISEVIGAARTRFPSISWRYVLLAVVVLDIISNRYRSFRRFWPNLRVVCSPRSISRTLSSFAQTGSAQLAVVVVVRGGVSVVYSSLSWHDLDYCVRLTPSS